MDRDRQPRLQPSASRTRLQSIDAAVRRNLAGSELTHQTRSSSLRSATHAFRGLARRGRPATRPGRSLLRNQTALRTEERYGALSLPLPGPKLGRQSRSAVPPNCLVKGGFSTRSLAVTRICRSCTRSFLLWGSGWGRYRHNLVTLLGSLIPFVAWNTQRHFTDRRPESALRLPRIALHAGPPKLA